MDCGASNFYSNVLVGKISSVEALPSDETRLTIEPEEVFRGQSEQLTVVTNEGYCIADFHVGERWLFFLFHTHFGPDKGLILEYGHGSKPVGEAGEDLALLRLQKSNPDTGIVRAHIGHGDFNDEFAKPQPLAQREVVLENVEHKLFAKSGSGGELEWQIVPPGKYKLRPSLLKDEWLYPSEVDIAAGSCSVLSLDVRTNGRISGRILTSTGFPAKDLQVRLDAGGSYRYAQTDANGTYEFDGLDPARYILTANTAPSSSQKPVVVYFPGVPDESHSAPVALGKAEHREIPDFHLPPLSESTRK